MSGLGSPADIAVLCQLTQHFPHFYIGNLCDGKDEATQRERNCYQCREHSLLVHRMPNITTAIMSSKLDRTLFRELES